MRYLRGMILLLLLLVCGVGVGPRHLARSSPACRLKTELNARFLIVDSFVPVQIFARDAVLQLQGPSLAAVARAVHAVAVRPALWTTGLPLHALPLPASPATQCWIVCMYFSLLLGVIAPMSRRVLSTGCALPLPPAGSSSKHSGGRPASSLRRSSEPQVPLIAVFVSSATWIALVFVANWAL